MTCVAGQRGEKDLGGVGDSLETLAHNGQGVFGGEEQNVAALPNGEATQAGGAGANEMCGFHGGIRLLTSAATALSSFLTISILFRLSSRNRG